MKKTFRIFSYLMLVLLAAALGFWVYYFIQTYHDLHDRKVAFGENQFSMMKSFAAMWLIYILYRVLDHYSENRDKCCTITFTITLTPPHH